MEGSCDADGRDRKDFGHWDLVAGTRVSARQLARPETLVPPHSDLSQVLGKNCARRKARPQGLGRWDSISARQLAKPETWSPLLVPLKRDASRRKSDSPRSRSPLFLVSVMLETVAPQRRPERHSSKRRFDRSATLAGLSGIARARDISPSAGVGSSKFLVISVPCR